jgi:hypothetical protein
MSHHNPPISQIVTASNQLVSTIAQAQPPSFPQANQAGNPPFNPTRLHHCSIEQLTSFPLVGNLILPLVNRATHVIPARHTTIVIPASKARRVSALQPISSLPLPTRTTHVIPASKARRESAFKPPITRNCSIEQLTSFPLVGNPPFNLFRPYHCQLQQLMSFPLAIVIPACWVFLNQLKFIFPITEL